MSLTQLQGVTFDPGSRKAALDAGASIFLNKAFEPQGLAAHTETLLDLT